jgi:hypothetical protein
MRLRGCSLPLTLALSLFARRQHPASIPTAYPLRLGTDGIRKL